MIFNEKKEGASPLPRIPLYPEAVFVIFLSIINHRKKPGERDLEHAVCGVALRSALRQNHFIDNDFINKEGGVHEKNNPQKK